MKVLRYALASGLLCAGFLTGLAQNKPAASSIQFTQPSPGSCEDNISYLNAAYVAANATGPNTLIIAIARLGDGERQRELNRRRLHNVRVYLTQFGWNRAPEAVITAEGERVKGYGRVELYVGGRLFDMIAVKNNGDLLVGSCEPDDIRPVDAERNLYPYRDKNL